MEYPKLQATTENQFILLEDYAVKSVVIPKGYRTNGADVPRIFWAIIPPFKPKFLPAVIVHDYYCDKEEYVLADNLFREILLDIEKSFITKAMVYSVKMYHKVKYKV